MNRLTERNEQGVAYVAMADTLPERDQEIEGSKKLLEAIYAIFQKLAAYEDTGLEPEDILPATELAEIYCRFGELMKYKELELEGRIIKLPCKLGDIVYIITDDFEQKTEYEIEERVFTVSLLEDDIHLFLTREEAEKALEVGNAENV